MLFGTLAISSAQQAATEQAAITAHWQTVTATAPTIVTTQILAHRYTLRTSSIHDALFQSLENLGTDDTRLQFWYSVTRQAVLEVEEPSATETHWDFQYADPLVADYYAHTRGKHHLNITTIPRWMFQVAPKQVPDSPEASFYPYTDDTRGDLLKDPSGRQIAEYQARIFSWYAKGGFTDEIGHFHKSGHHYKIDYWDVLNEPDFENKITVEQFTRIYDAVTETIHKIDPHVEFFAPEVSGAEVSWARYFLDAKNHKPGSLPVAWFTFHNYVNAPNDPSTWRKIYFNGPAKNDTDGASAQVLIDRLRQVMKIRDELSPKTKVIIDELGVFDDVKTTEEACRADEPYQAYLPLYWNAIGANWAAIFVAVQRLEMPMFSMSQMIGYPTQCPSISMFDKDTARPNSHYWVLSLIHRHFAPMSKLVQTESTSDRIEAQAEITPQGRKLLLINTTEQPVTVEMKDALPASAGKSVLTAEIVDQASGEQPPSVEHLAATQITLAPFAVAVVTTEQPKGKH